MSANIALLPGRRFVNIKFPALEREFAALHYQSQG
jgi:hypothetical protein